jgi:DNA-directed RNA polymerase subunit E'/Rpb7
MNMENDIFCPVVGREKVRIAPSLLSKKVRDIVTSIVIQRIEGKCGVYGYVRPSSVEILKISSGEVRTVSLNGDIIFNVEYKMEACNPVIGKVVKAHVTNTNKFGVLAEVLMTSMNEHGNAENIPIIEIIITKQAVGISSNIDLDGIKIGDEINVEILGKKFEMNDLKISAIGRVVLTDKKGGAEKNTETTEYYDGIVTDNEEEEAEEDEEVEEEEDVEEQEAEDVVDEELDEDVGEGLEEDEDFDVEGASDIDLDDLDDDGSHVGSDIE